MQWIACGGEKYGIGAGGAQQEDECRHTEACSASVTLAGWTVLSRQFNGEISWAKTFPACSQFVG